MNIEKTTKNGKVIAVITGNEKVIIDVQSVLDLMMTVKYEAGTNLLAIDKRAIVEDFFILSRGLAGEILQKFINYQAKIAIFGDFSEYTSKPLKDFIYESNKASLSGFGPIRFSSADIRTFCGKNSRNIKYCENFSLVCDEYLLDENGLPPKANDFLMDFAEARRRKVKLFKTRLGERREKASPLGLWSSSPLRLRIFSLWQPSVKRQKNWQACRNISNF